MTHYDPTRPELGVDLASILDELDVSGDETPTISPNHAPWYEAAVSASLRYHDWALIDAARHQVWKEAVFATWARELDQKRTKSSAARKCRRIAKAEREGREYKPRRSLKGMSAEDRAARRREQNRVNQNRRRKGPAIEDHALFGKYS